MAIDLEKLEDFLRVPLLEINPYLEVPFAGPQSSEFRAWQEGAQAMLEAIRDAAGFTEKENRDG